jgi:hypothetical protein
LTGVVATVIIARAVTIARGAKGIAEGCLARAGGRAVTIAATRVIATVKVATVARAKATAVTAITAKAVGLIVAAAIAWTEEVPTGLPLRFGEDSFKFEVIIICFDEDLYIYEKEYIIFKFFQTATAILNIL